MPDGLEAFIAENGDRENSTGRQGFGFTLELVDLVNGVVIARQAASWKATSGLLIVPTELIEGSAADNYMGQLPVLANQEEAMVHLDNIEVSSTPLSTSTDSIGRHRVQVKKAGSLTRMVINHRETTFFKLSWLMRTASSPGTRGGGSGPEQRPWWPAR